jgi:hypothetical protein
MVLGNPLTDVLRILAGEEEILNEKTNAWYELLVAKVLYQEPYVRKSEIRYIELYLNIPS